MSTLDESLVELTLVILELELSSFHVSIDVRRFLRPFHDQTSYLPD